MNQHRRGPRRLVSVPTAAAGRGYTVDEDPDGELDPQLLMLQTHSPDASTR